jgi:hypothetical protein
METFFIFFSFVIGWFSSLSQLSLAEKRRGKKAPQKKRLNDEKSRHRIIVSNQQSKTLH